jgi:pyruvate formate lyase activating enzyme
LEDVYEVVRKVHAPSREEYGLPLDIPKSEEGIVCKICGNNCQIEEGQRGFCGLRYLEGGKLKGPTPTLANLIYYHDPLPTNCVAEWTCAATGNAYPKYSYRNGPEYGYKNLAIFYQGCSFNCLFCQNWHYKEGLEKPNWVGINEVLKAVDERTACICYFGGDPGPQILNSILISERAKELKRGKILRFCWETNGNLNRKYLDTIIRLALESGGCIKFDLKAYDLKLHYILTGISNAATLNNFRYVAKYINERRNPPLLIASTLLIPGYVEAEEVYKIAKFIAELDENIPYSLLAFYPQYYFSDLPVTSKEQAYSCLEAAKDAGLRNVHIGNIHLLT